MKKCEKGFFKACSKFIGKAAKIGANDRMRAFDLMIDRFAKIVKKTRTTSRNRIKTKLGCHDAAEIGNLKGVREHILPI